jgi:hypothetical protein
MHGSRSPSHRSRWRQPATANRAPGYVRPSDVNLAPEKFFNYRGSSPTVCPETALMYAVLENAFLCFHKHFETDARHIEQAQQAQEWFFSDDSDWLFSFLSVCDVLGLEPQYMRKKLKRWNPPRLDTT